MTRLWVPAVRRRTDAENYYNNILIYRTQKYVRTRTHNRPKYAARTRIIGKHVKYSNTSIWV